MADLHELTALEQGALIRSGETDPVELAEHYLARAEALPAARRPTVGSPAGSP